MIAKGPNILNLNAYTQGEQQQGQYTQQIPSDRPIVDSKAIQDQFDNFVKQLHKYAQVLSSVAKNIDQASQDQFITDFYPQFILDSTYEEDQQKKVIASSDPELAKVITNLQRTNRILKQQMKGWVFQFAKKTKLSEVLLNENQILRKAILTKNKEIVRLIQNIGKTQNEQIEELKQNLEQLNQQNGVLLDHFNKIKQDLKDKKQDQKRINEALQNSKKALLDAEKKCKETEDKEQHFSKMVALLEDSIQQMQKRKRKLQKEKNRLQNFKKQYSKDRLNLQNQVNLCENDKKQIENNLKKKFQQLQSEKNSLIQKIQEQTEKVQKQKDETRFYEGEISKNQRRIQQFNNLNKDLKQKNLQNQLVLKRLKTQFQQILQIQSKNASDIDILNFDIEQLKQEIEKHDKTQKKLIQFHKKQVKQIDEGNKNYLIDLQSKQAKINRQMAMKILQQKSQLSIKEKQIEKWETKIFQKKEQITDLKSQIKQIKNNQLKMSQLRQKLRQQEKKI